MKMELYRNGIPYTLVVHDGIELLDHSFEYRVDVFVRGIYAGRTYLFRNTHIVADCFAFVESCINRMVVSNA